MIHLWELEGMNLTLNTKELLKYPILSKVFIDDKSKEKADSHRYFRYLDFMTNSKGYCITNGLNFKEADAYSKKQCSFPKSYEFPANNKSIIEFVKENLEYDPIAEALSTSIKTLRISSKTLNSYVDIFNEMDETDYKDADGNVIDVTSTINRVMKTIAEIPNTIIKYNELLEKYKSNNTVLRGGQEFRESMEGDAHLEQLELDEDE